jgi:hypothetical protein
MNQCRDAQKGFKSFRKADQVKDNMFLSSSLPNYWKVHLKDALFLSKCNLPVKNIQSSHASQDVTALFGNNIPTRYARIMCLTKITVFNA